MTHLKSSFSFLVCCLFAVLTGLPAQAQVSRIDTILQTYQHKPNLVLVAAHRGAHQDFPENSLASIDEAIRIGAHVVELDVRETKDGVLIIMHDKTVDRTTTGIGAVESFSFAELQELFLTHRGKPTSHRIPTLEEALLRTKGKILMDIDFKAEKFETAKRVYEMVSSLGMDEQVVFFLYDYKKMPTLYKLNPAIKVMPRAYSMKDVNRILKMNMTNIIHVDKSFMKKAKELTILKNTGIRIWANTLGDVDRSARENPQSYRAFFEGMEFVNVVQTDQPALVVNYLKE